MTETELKELEKIVSQAALLLPRMAEETQNEFYRAAQRPGVSQYLTVGCPSAEHSFLSNSQQSLIDDFMAKMVGSNAITGNQVREWADAVSKAAYFQTKSESYLKEMTLEGRTSALAQVITLGFEHERYRDNMTGSDWRGTVSFALGGDSSPAELPVIQHTASLSKEERGMVAVHITAAMGTNAPPAAIIMAVDLARKNENIYSLLHNSPSSFAASSVYELTAIEVAVAIGQNPLDSDAAVMEAIANHPNPEVGQILVRQLDQGFAKIPEQTQAKICESVLNNKTTALDSITRRVLESGSLPQSLQDRIRALPFPETISVGHEDYRYYTDKVIESVYHSHLTEFSPKLQGVTQALNNLKAALEPVWPTEINDVPPESKALQKIIQTIAKCNKNDIGKVLYLHNLLEEKNSGDLKAGSAQYSTTHLPLHTALANIRERIEVDPDITLFSRRLHLPRGSSIHAEILPDKRLESRAFTTTEQSQKNDPLESLKTLLDRQFGAAGYVNLDQLRRSPEAILSSQQRRLLGLDSDATGDDILRALVQHKLVDDDMPINQKVASGTRSTAYFSPNIVGQDKARENVLRWCTANISSVSEVLKLKPTRTAALALGLGCKADNEEIADVLVAQGVLALPASSIDSNPDISKPQPFSEYSRSEIEEFISTNQLGGLLEKLGNDPTTLAQTLSFLKANVFEDRSISEFVVRYVGLSVGERSKEAGASEDRKKEKSPEEPVDRQVYFEALLEAVQSQISLDLSEQNLNRQTQLLIRLSRRDFEANPDRLSLQLRIEGEKVQGMDISEENRQFLSELYNRAANHFDEINQFAVHGLKTTPYGFQKEGIKFLTERETAVLADEVGLGKTLQAIGAVETLQDQAKRVLWITTASNRQSVAEEILLHSTNTARDVLILGGENREDRLAAIARNDAKYVIINYECLRDLYNKDRQSYNILTKNLDVVIVDESQRIDNIETQQSRAVRNIDANRKWLLSASPYQSKPENLWTVLNYVRPEEYPNKKAFVDLYTRSTSSMMSLHDKLQDTVIRRNRSDVAEYFLPTSIEPFESQLSDGRPRLPNKERISPENSLGTFYLTENQCNAIAEMIADFPGWIDAHNRNAPVQRHIDLRGNSSFRKFHYIHKAIYEPESIGISGKNNLWEGVDRIVTNSMQNGEKIILWGFNVAVLDEIENRYGQYGLVRIDGDPKRDRDGARRSFQEDPNTRIMAANYLSGGVGLTLTAADRAVFVQLPLVFTSLYQAEGRHQRLIAPRHVEHAKEMVYTEFAVPQYPPAFFETLQNDALSELMSDNGTIVEQTIAKLQSGEAIFSLIMEGYGDPSMLEKYFESELMATLSLDKAEAKLSTVDAFINNLPQEIQNVARSTVMFSSQLRAADTPERQALVLDLIDDFSHNPQYTSSLGQALELAPGFVGDDLKFIQSVFSIRSGFIRDQILTALPQIATDYYSQGRTLSEAVEGLGIDRLSADGFIGRILLRDIHAQSVEDINISLADMPDNPRFRALSERLAWATASFLGSPEKLSQADQMLSILGERSLDARVDAFVQMGVIVRCGGEIPETTNFNDAASVESWTRETLCSLFSDIIGIPDTDVTNAINANQIDYTSIEQSLIILKACENLDNNTHQNVR